MHDAAQGKSEEDTQDGIQRLWMPDVRSIIVTATISERSRRRNQALSKGLAATAAASDPAYRPGVLWP